MKTSSLILHDLLTAVERLPPLKIAVADATVRHVIASLKEGLCPPSLPILGGSLVFNYRSMGTLASRGEIRIPIICKDAWPSNHIFPRRVTLWQR